MSGRQVEDAYPLSPLQEGMLFHALAAGEPGMYVTQAGYTLAGPLDVARFESAWQTVMRRHPALRTAFAWKSAETPIQVVGRDVRVPLAVEDWRGLPAAERDRRWEERLAADRARGIDPARAPLLRLFLAREEESLHRLLWTHHHLLLDGWSVGIVLQEAFAAYTAALRGEEPALPPAAPYRAYIAWLRRRDPAEAEPFWRRELAGFTAPTPLPWSAGDPAAEAGRDGERSLRLPTGAADALRARSRLWQVTPSTLINAAWGLLLGRHAGEDDVVFGVTTAGRPPDLAGVEGIVGLFINTLPLRIDVRPDQPLLPWLRALQERQVEMRQHEHVPLVTVQGWSEVPRGLPLFESFVAFESYPVDRSPGAGEEGLAVRDVRAVERTSYPLGVAASPSLSLRATFDPRRFDAVTVERLLGQVATLLLALAPEGVDGGAIGDLPLLADEERAQLLTEWNDTELPLPAVTVPDLFAARAVQAPAAVAVAAGERTLSYGELAARADRLARRLRGRGIGSGDVVGVACERSLDLVVALLGVLRAGAVFLPLDPSHPPERTAWIAADAGAVAILTGDLDGGEEAGWPPVAPGAPAYLIYTSGTTGRPKGVLVEHRNLAATLLGAAATFGFDAADRMPCVAPVPFDIFLFELLSPLLAGGTAVLVPLVPALDVEALVDLLAEATRFHAVPALMRQVADAVRAREAARRFPALRTLFVGGDAVPASLLAELREIFPAAEVRVLYGPTETAILCASHRLGEAGIEAPIGRPLPNVELRLCDRHGRLAPAGAPGEIWIGGPGVARGYHHRDELTAERFREIGGRRFYRSGDRARWRPGGTLEFLGRIDQQVKIRGVRIEPAEIEAVLAAQPGVRAAVVVARPGAAGEKSLLACVVPAADGELTPAGLRGRLRELLPEALVPSEIVLLADLPVTAHGKVDRAALARLRAAGTPAGRAPRDPLEELVAGIFAEVLGREEVGAGEDFFELGGHSLLATRVVARLRAALGVELPLRELFEAPTAAALARRVAAAGGGGRPAPPPLRRMAREELPPLSFAQERLWFLHRLDPESAAYLLPLALRFSGPLHVPAWAAALGTVAERHEVLRTTFPEVAGVARQRVHPPAAVALPVVDFSALPPLRREAELPRLAQSETRRPFDLERGPLFRAMLVRLAAEEHAALFSLHHLISDGWSMGVLVRELAAAYRAAAAGRRPELPELPVQYGDYAAWQRSWLTGPAQEALLADWTGQLAGAPEVLELPADRPRPPVQSFRGAARPFALAPELSRDLLRLSRRQGGTPFLTLLAALLALLRRWCGEDDLSVGTPVAGRTHLETEPLIGLFLNTLVLRVRLDGGMRFDQLLARVRETALAAFARQDLPFEKLVEALQPRRSLSYNPLFQVMLAYQNVPREELELPGLAVRPLALAETATRFDLELMAAERDGRLAGTLKFATDLFDLSTGERLLTHLETLLAAAVAAPGSALAELPVLTPGERHQLLCEWTGEPAGLPAETCAHDWIAEQALRTPEAVAAVCGGGRLTYAELLARADALAGRLAGEGAGPETVVAVLAERGLGFLTAVLAVLSTGAAYLPLHRSHPPARLAAVLRRSGASLALVDSASADQLGRARVASSGESVERVFPRVLPLDGGEGPRSARRATAGPGSLAYVIFTSGSTGTPKGAMVPHRGMRNHLIAKVRDLGLGPRDRVAQTASQGFDISVWQMLAPLAVGGCVEIFADEVAHDPARLLDAVESTGVTVLEMVPSLFRFLLDEAARRGAAPPRLASLRWLILTGEALPPELARRWCALYPRVAVMNAYGPTECSDRVSHHVLAQAPPGGASQVPIGRPVANTRLMVLDRDLQAMPQGARGQLCVGGPPVGRGYLGDPAQTAAVFLPDPCAAEPGARMYATGDLARFAPGGRAEFLGRIDHQVKVRGLRIELGEVEAALAALPEVAQAAAVAGERSGLTAFVVLRPDAAADPRALREALRAVLPDAMVPGRIVPLAALPLSSNGKVDRKALARLRPEPAAPEAADAPAGAVAELLAELWAKLLAVERAGARDHFFDLGGHSLLAIQLAAGVRRALGVELPLREIFERPVLADLAAAVESLLRGDRNDGQTPVPPLVRVPRGRPLPLSSAQQRLWFFDRWEPGSSAYNVPSAVRLEGDLDAAALAGALGEIVRRHEILRTTYVDLDGEPGQVIGPPAPVPLPLIDLAALPPDARESEASRLAAAEGARPFDLARGPVLRAALLRLARREHAALLTLHHIAADAWSARLLVGEIASLYAAFHAGRPSPLTELPVQYADFAVWQRGRLAGGSLQRQLDWWRERLGRLRELELPTDRPRPAVQSFRGAQRATVLPFLPALRILARAEDATLFMVLLAAFAVVLAHRSGQDDVVVGTNVAGRTRAEVEGLIGFFLNMLVLRTDLSGDPAFRELLARVRETALGAYAHQEVPFDRILEVLRVRRDPGRHPLFQVKVDFQVLEESQERLSDLVLRPLPPAEAASHSDLTVYFTERPDGIGVVWEHNTDLFDAATILDLAADLERVLRRAVEAPDIRLSALRSLLEAEAERRRAERERDFQAARRGEIRSFRRRAVAAL